MISCHKVRVVEGLYNYILNLYSPVNLTFDLKQIAFDCFIVLSCKVYLGVCPRENLPKSRVWNMVKFKFEIKHFF